MLLCLQKLVLTDVIKRNEYYVTTLHQQSNPQLYQKTFGGLEGVDICYLLTNTTLTNHIDSQNVRNPRLLGYD